MFVGQNTMTEHRDVNRDVKPRLPWSCSPRSLTSRSHNFGPRNARNITHGASAVVVRLIIRISGEHRRYS